MRSKCFFVLFFSFLLTMVSCNDNKYEPRLRDYLNANTVEEKRKWMADEYRSYFFSKDDEGKDRSAALASFDNWDGNLNPDIRITDKIFSSKEKKWTITILEQNDFSKLIGYPGWKAIEEISFNANGKISEMIYKPDSTNPPYKKWLLPALDWLELNKPAELTQIYYDNKLVKTKTSALLWVKVLSEWQKAKKPDQP